MTTWEANLAKTPEATSRHSSRSPAFAQPAHDARHGQPTLVALHPPVTPEKKGTGNNLQALARAIDDLSGRIVLNACHHVDTLRRLTALRRANHQLQDAFHGLEKVLPENANRLEAIFADEPRAEEAGLPLEWNSGGMIQILPVPSGGVSAIQLFIANILRSDGAVLRIHLTTLEDQQVVDRWTVPLDRLTEGWTSFSLSRVMTGAARTLELRLNLEGKEGARLMLGRGAAQPLPLFQLRHGPKAAVRPFGLAMRVMCGAPHAASAAGPHYMMADTRRATAANVTETPLAPLLLAKATHANAGSVAFDFPPVKSLSSQVAVECHPPSTGFTLAQVPLPPSARPVSVSAEAAIRNPKSKPIEFAIVLTDDADRVQPILAGTAEPLAHEGFSGWTAASAEESAHPRAAIARPDRKRPKLYLATRMKASADNFFAWATFRNIQMQVPSS